MFTKRRTVSVLCALCALCSGSVHQALLLSRLTLNFLQANFFPCVLFEHVVSSALFCTCDKSESERAHWPMEVQAYAGHIILLLLSSVAQKHYVQFSWPELVS